MMILPNCLKVDKIFFSRHSFFTSLIQTTLHNRYAGFTAMLYELYKCFSLKNYIFLIQNQSVYWQIKCIIDILNFIFSMIEKWNFSLLLILQNTNPFIFVAFWWWQMCRKYKFVVKYLPFADQKYYLSFHLTILLVSAQNFHSHFFRLNVLHAWSENYFVILPFFTQLLY